MSDPVAALANDPRVVTTAIDGGTWYHLTGLNLETDKPLVRALVGSESLARGLTEWHPRPYTMDRGGKRMIIMKGPNLTGKAKVEDMIALRILRDSGNVFSFSVSPLKTVDEVRGLAESNRFQADMLIARLGQTITSRLRQVVSTMNDELDHIEDEVIDPDSPMPSHRLMHFRRQVIGFKRAAGPQSLLFQELAEEEEYGFSEESRGTFEQAANSGTRIDEILDAMRQRAESLADLIVAEGRKVSERFSYMLTVAAGIFLPLNLIAGMFGANVGGLPMLDNPNGFLYFCLLLVAFAVVSWGLSELVLRWIAKKK